MGQIEIKHYTAADLRQWQTQHVAIDGLSEAVISPSKAWSIINNPYVLDNDPVVAAIFDHGKLAAITGAYPEVFLKPSFIDKQGQQKRIWWFYKLWCDPEFRGKGYGLVAIGSLAEIYGEDCAWTAWGTREATEIFTYLGLNTHYFTRFFMGNKAIQSKSLKGLAAAMVQQCHIWWHRLSQKKLPTLPFSIRYLTNVDDETYSFITQHSEKHFFLSSLQFINWELQFERVSKRQFVQVWVKGTIVGTYMTIQTDNQLVVNYLYYKTTHSDTVFTSIAEHIRTKRINHFETEDAELAKFIRKYCYFPKHTEEQLTLSISESIHVNDHIIR